MKMLKNAYILLAVALFLTSCGGNKPEKAAVNFHKALINQDFEEAKKYCTKESASMLDMVASMTAMMGAEKLSENKEKVKDAKITVVSSEIDKENKTATVVIKTSIKDEDEAKEETYQLKEVDGEWKVVFSK